MKNLNVSLTPASGAPVFESARALAFSLAETDPALVEPHDGRLEVDVGERSVSPELV